MLKFSEIEVDIENSGFVDPETLDERIKKESEKFTPIAYNVFSNFLKEYGATKSSIMEFVDFLRI